MTQCHRNRCTQVAVAQLTIHTTKPLALPLCEKHAKEAEHLGREVIWLDLGIEPPTITTHQLVPQEPSPGWRGLVG